MITMIRLVLIAFALCLTILGQAQVPVTASADHDRMLASADPKVAANKRLVYDFWREILEANQLDRAEKYLTESYIQHNPNVPTGRAGFVTFFQQFAKAKPVAPKIAGPLVAIVAEGDFVVLSFASEVKDPKDPTKKYTTTWFDMFRIDSGKIAEHWDPALKN